jgi:N6-adenosine-specific RNA methylase IME4
MKKRAWIIRRHTVETVDAQRRWDYAYQCLVQWSTTAVSEFPHEHIQQESRHESRDVCARLYTASSANADH